MAKTITLKNLPDLLHARLAAAAKRHRRSLNNEAIVCLEAGLGHGPLAVEQQLAEIRALRNSLGQHSFDPAEIDAFKREGRP
ncbi:FitA-like ribbon-helix-helix domain-containing protein [Cyanobium sp. ATX-6F1]|nr:plasmid stability protein [Cyanobium sp. ATX 6F1]